MKILCVPLCAMLCILESVHVEGAVGTRLLAPSSAQLLAHEQGWYTHRKCAHMDSSCVIRNISKSSFANYREDSRANDHALVGAGDCIHRSIPPLPVLILVHVEVCVQGL